MKKILRFIVTVILLTTLYVVLERFTDMPTGLIYVNISFALPLLCAGSVVFGPVFGFFSALLGQVIMGFLYDSIDWPASVCCAIAISLIGFSMRNVDIKNGFWERSDILRFIGFQFLIFHFCWLLIYPAFRILLFHHPVSESFTAGFQEAQSCTYSCMVIATLYLTVYASSRVSAANFYRR